VKSDILTILFEIRNPKKSSSYIPNMEQYLLGALSSDQQIREESNKFLQNSEKFQGFCLKMIETFNISSNQGKILSLISLKNCIQKHWNNTKRIPLDEKEKVKIFLVQSLYGQNDYKKFIAEAVISINKHDFLDTWGDLTRFFAVFHQDEFYLSLFHAVVKVQLKKGSSRCKANLKSTFKEIEGDLVENWRNFQDVFTSKLMMKSLIFSESVPYLAEVLSRCYDCLSREDEKLVKIYIKGLNQVIFRCPQAIFTLLNGLVQLFLQVLLRPGISQVFQDTSELVFTALTELMSKQVQSLPLLEPHLDALLNKSLTFEVLEWDLWSSGDRESLLMSLEDSEVIHSFQERLLKSFPDLLGKVASLLNQDLTFLQVHSLCGLYGILSRFPGSVEGDFQLIIQKFSGVFVEGVEKLVLFRDLLILTKKWLGLLKDLSFVFNLLMNIKKTTNDWVVLYECCLVLKQMTYNPIPGDLLVRIVEEFALVAFELIGQVSSSACVWHLTGFIRNLIEASHNDLIFIQALKDFGLQKLIVDSNEITVQSIGDMIESLLVKNKGNEQINHAFSCNLQSRLARKDKDAPSHWLTFLFHFSGDLRHIEALIQFFPMISEKQFALQVKLAQEYLLIYYEGGFSLKIQEFLKNFTNFNFFSRDFERDYLSLELLFCISSVYQANFGLTRELLGYLELNDLDTFEGLCKQNALLVLCRYLLIDSDQLTGSDLSIFFQNLKHLQHHNHLSFASSALNRILKNLSDFDHLQLKPLLSYSGSQASLNPLQTSSTSLQSPRHSFLFHL
jgi:hypothetical protein